MAKPEVKAEAIRLRVEERKSLRDIKKQLTGVSQGILSLWLRPYPLSSEERSAIAKAKRALQPNTPRASLGPESENHARLSGQVTERDHKGRVAEITVALRLAQHGFLVYKPLFDGTRVDWLAYNPMTGAYNRIQVKWARRGKHGLPSIQLRCREGRGRRNYTDKDIDYVVGYYFFSDTIYVWTISELADKKSNVSCSEAAKDRWDKLK